MVLRRQLAFYFAGMAPFFLACSQSSSAAPKPNADAGIDASGDARTALCEGGVDCSISNIKHVVIIVQENHTFDSYFGRYCTAITGSNPTCTEGPGCCEAAPKTEPTGSEPVILDDKENGEFNPDHDQPCEVAELNAGKMDQFVTGPACGNKRNVAYATAPLMDVYWDYAHNNALADRYFQPIAGQSTANDMYFARARYVFTDNEFLPKGATGTVCQFAQPTAEYNDLTLGDLLTQSKVSWTWYSEGYQAMIDAQKLGNCPEPPPLCPIPVPVYPCTYDPGDVPFAFYPSARDKPQSMRDYVNFILAVDSGTLPAVSFVKAVGYHSEHPAVGITITAGVTFVKGVVDRVMKSPYAKDTLVILTYDEGGGYFDHVSPPKTSAVDNQPYGTRVPMLAIGTFARKNTVSHVTMEHSSLVKVIEWNWLSRTTGQLGNRDKVVHNIGSMLDPTKTGVEVPAD
ncbi:MAG: hypothetical protein NVS3B20_11750 [Polyangiales bacterium]